MNDINKIKLNFVVGLIVLWVGVFWLGVLVGALAASGVTK